jgi:tetratricopeptide (TPR) repeat protein
MPDVARELGVDTLIDGQVTRSGDSVRVNVRQLDGSTGRILWQHAYAANIRDVLALQHEVATGISRQVSGAVADPPTDSAGTPVRQVDPQAYEAFLKATYFFDRQTDAGFEKALRYYQESIARDPGFAPAHARLGEYYAFLAYVGRVSPEQGYGAADRELEIALRLDPRSPLAHMQRGMIDLTYRCQRDEADRELSLAMRLDPSDMRVLDYHSYYLLAVGRTDEAIAEKRRVLEHDPASVVTSGELGLYLLVAGRTDEAIRQLQSALELDPDDAIARGRLGWAYADAGKYGPAVEELQRALSRDRSPSVLGRLGEVYARWGRADQALAVVDQLNDMARSRYVSPLLVARIYARLGDSDTAFKWLAKARPGEEPTIDDPGFAALRADRRIAAVRSHLMPSPGCVSL